MSLLFIAVSSAYTSAENRRSNEARLEAISDALAPDMAWRETARISHFLEAEQLDALVIDPEGRVLSGNPAVADLPRADRTPVLHDNRQVGTLISAPMPAGPSQVVLVAQISVLLISLIFAFVTAAFYARRVSRDVMSLSEFTDRLGQDQPLDRPSGVDFVEFSRLRATLHLAASRIQRQRENLRKAAFSDTVTGLPNTAAALDFLREAAETATFEAPAAYAHIQLDGQNGADVAVAGHATLHKAVAERMNTELDNWCKSQGSDRDGYLVARMDGGQLGLVILQAVDRAEVSSVLRAMRRALLAPLEINGHKISVRLQGGVALVPEDGERPALVVERAERAFASVPEGDEADSTGFRFYTPRLDRIEEGRLRMVAELRDGVAKDEFKAVFQPKVDFRTGRISGFEALARWRRGPERTISPGVFIPLAEETGLIREIGNSILSQSCRKAKEWVSKGIEATVAVNVSALQLTQRDFVETVIDTLRESGLPPRYLELEITESMAVTDPGRVAEVMQPLRAMGVKLAIDDFGTGHSNLAILTQLPFTTFKIDRAFVAAIDKSSEAAAIIEMILAMAETVGLETVAEGIETPRQADFLRRRGCNVAQGFLYSPAIAAKEVISFTEDWNAGQTEERPRAVGDI